MVDTALIAYLVGGGAYDGYVVKIPGELEYLRMNHPADIASGPDEFYWYKLTHVNYTPGLAWYMYVGEDTPDDAVLAKTS